MKILGKEKICGMANEERFAAIMIDRCDIGIGMRKSFWTPHVDQMIDVFRWPHFVQLFINYFSFLSCSDKLYNSEVLLELTFFLSALIYSKFYCTTLNSFGAESAFAHWFAVEIFLTTPIYFCLKNKLQYFIAL